MSIPNTNFTNSSLTITNDDTNNPNNIPLDSSNHPIIPTLTTGTTYTESTFTTNSWGYKLSTDTSYSGVPSSLELLNTNSAPNAITTTLNLAAKVNANQFAGVYSATLNFGLVGKVAMSSFEIRSSAESSGYHYFASEGMTWQEWINSDYNTGGYSFCGGGINKVNTNVAKSLTTMAAISGTIPSPSTRPFVYVCYGTASIRYNGDFILPSDTIVDGAEYIIRANEGGAVN